MSLCHAIIIKGDATLIHEVWEMDAVRTLPGERLLSGPHYFCGKRFVFAAVRAADAKTQSNFTLGQEINVFLSIVIVDDLEQKPLLAGSTPARSIFLLGEIIDGIIESLRTLGFQVHTVFPSLSQNRLTMEFGIQSGLTRDQCVGGFMCFMTLLDGLLFDRGLKIHLPQVELVHSVSSLPPQFVLAIERVVVGSIHAGV